MTQRKPLPETLPCPACGRRAETERMGLDMENWVGCNSSEFVCGVVGPTKKTERAAILAWNRMIEHPKGVKKQ